MGRFDPDEVAIRQSMMGIKPRKRVYHMADKMDGNGNVSAMCFKSPRPINLNVAWWTTAPEAVTCSKCKRAMRGKEQGA